MIMPANYSAIAENELSYVNGGYVEPITSTTILEKNIVEYIGNAFSGRVINAFIGNWFKPNGAASTLGVVWGGIKDLFNNGIDDVNTPTTAGKIFRGLTNTIGVLGGIYMLGFYDDAVKPASVADFLKADDVIVKA